MIFDKEKEFQRLKSIERNLAVLRMFVGILPLWVAGEVLIRLSRETMWGYGLTVLGLTGVLLLLGTIRLAMTTSIVGPEHRFFNDATRVAAFIDHTRERGYIPIYGPSELLRLKALNLLFQPLGWGLLLAIMFGGMTYVVTAFSGSGPFPIFFELFLKWGMPALFLCFVFIAISNGIATINSKDVNDFPVARAILSSKKSNK